MQPSGAQMLPAQQPQATAEASALGAAKDLQGSRLLRPGRSCLRSGEASAALAVRALGGVLVLGTSQGETRSQHPLRALGPGLADSTCRRELATALPSLAGPRGVNSEQETPAGQEGGRRSARRRWTLTGAALAVTGVGCHALCKPTRDPGQNRHGQELPGTRPGGDRPSLRARGCRTRVLHRPPTTCGAHAGQGLRTPCFRGLGQAPSLCSPGAAPARLSLARSMAGAGPGPWPSQQPQPGTSPGRTCGETGGQDMGRGRAQLQAPPLPVGGLCQCCAEADVCTGNGALAVAVAPRGIRPGAGASSLLGLDLRRALCGMPGRGQRDLLRADVAGRGDGRDTNRTGQSSGHGSFTPFPALRHPAPYGAVPPAACSQGLGGHGNGCTTLAAASGILRDVHGAWAQALGTWEPQSRGRASLATRALQRSHQRRAARSCPAGPKASRPSPGSHSSGGPASIAGQRLPRYGQHGEASGPAQPARSAPAPSPRGQ